MQQFIFILLFLFCTINIFSQDVGIQQWKDYVPYNNANNVVNAGELVYCASDLALFSYNKSSGEITKYSKINGLSDIGIKKIDYSDLLKTLIIAYSNSNIDLIKDNRIVNLSDIKRKIIQGNKSINNIYIKDNLAYISCGFGIIVLDINKEEIKDTYYVDYNLSVNDIVEFNNYFYVATDKGIYKAPVSGVNLSNPSSWSLINFYPDNKISQIEVFNDKIIVNIVLTNTDAIYYYDGSTFNIIDSSLMFQAANLKAHKDKLFLCTHYNAISYNTNFERNLDFWNYTNLTGPSCNILEITVDDENVFWLADKKLGLLKTTDTWNYELLTPNSPLISSAFDLDILDDNICIASGSYNESMGNTWSTDGVCSFNGSSWKQINKENTSKMDTIFDIVCVAYNPEDKNHFFAGSWKQGLLEFKNNELINIYNELNTNNAISRVAISYYWAGIGGLKYDKNGNLWMSNANVEKQLVVKTKTNSWHSYSLGPIFKNAEVSKILIDNNNYKWVICPKGKGIAVFNDNNTLDNTTDDNLITLSNSVGKGNLPSNDVHSIAMDLDGSIWIGTTKGLAVFYNPENIFSDENFDAQQIKIEQDSYVQYLLGTETVTDIAVDGANRKWCGTKTSGVYLFSKDGQEEIYHFTSENSPLFSDNIISITINEKNGEVFFGTDKGLISFKGTATKGEDEYNNVFAYPNPVESDYTGLIAIKGLVKDANVKITDISGNLVYEVFAEGGQAVWDGKNFSGERVKTGVYVVFCTNTDGSKTYTTKILVIN